MLTPLSCRYEHADGLVGVYREQEENSSRTLTLDLSKVSWRMRARLTVAVRVDFISVGEDHC